MQDEQLIVFLKARRPGAVKTRLAKTMGADAACGAYRQLVETVLGNLSRLGGVELRFTPDDAAAEIKPWLRPGWQSRPQGEGDLGARMARAFEEAFSAGAKRVVIIGSDCPEVTAQDIIHAWNQLKSCDVALGPATDGGYWLVGLNQSQPGLFEGMAWGGESVLADTMAKAANLRVEILRILTDIDTEKDWREFRKAAPRPA